VELDAHRTLNNPRIYANEREFFVKIREDWRIPNSFNREDSNMDTNQVLRTDLQDGVLALTLNRPKVNAFNFELIESTQAAFKEAGRDPQVRCVLLTGSGGVFSAGQDVSEFRKAENISFRHHLQRTYNPLVLTIRRLEKPVLASINGAVSGAALGLTLACDLRIAADTARFVVGFLGIGLAPDSAVSLLLPTLIGLGRAAEFAFSNAPINAEQALAWGLVNRVVPAGELAGRAAEWARQLAQGPIHAMGLAKRDFNQAVLPNLEQVLDYEAHIQEVAGQGYEHKEGVSAFLEKRTPQFKADGS
jgi:2-(1,2-epoxy-1,2-dihydrophenyl)acetyl-CoA isomerase